MDLITEERAAAEDAVAKLIGLTKETYGDFKVGDKVLLKAGYGIGLNRTMRRAITRRRPATILRFMGDAALVMATRGTMQMSAWVNAKEIAHA